MGSPTAFPFRAPVYRGCPCRDPPVCHRVQDDSGAMRQPTLWLLVFLESLHRVLTFHVCRRVHAYHRPRHMLHPDNHLSPNL